MVLNLLTGLALGAGTTLSIDATVGDDKGGYSLPALATGAAVVFFTATVSHRVFI